MHTLIPHFIYEQYLAGAESGRFDAVTLLMDIVGFTAMTQSLMQHGKEGVEVLALMINNVFDPIISAVEQHGGFVSLFAGDALTVLFPADDPHAALAACQTALTSAQVFAAQGIQATRLGSYRLTIRQGLSAGEVEWGIIGPETRKSYFFRGAAIRGCARAGQQAQDADILIDARLRALLDPSMADWQPGPEPYARLQRLRTAAPVRPAPPARRVIDPQTAARFFPQTVWHRPQQGEFRYVTTLFVGFQGVDDAGALAAFITGVIQTTSRFDGYFVEIDFSHDEGFFLVYFGAPITHEDDIGRALDFMLTLQAELRETAVGWRAGIAAGPVYAGYVGTLLRDKYGCVGSIVNLAARLMMHAGWGEIWVSDMVARHPGFDFTLVGERRYKGFHTPIPTHRLQQKTVAERVFPHKLVGRERELDQLIRFAGPLFAGRQAGTAIMYGEAGMGKSRLAYGLRQALGARVRWLTGQTDPILRQTLNPFVYFLRRYFNQTGTATEAENRAAFNRRFQELLTALARLPDTQPLQDELQRTRTVLGALLGLSWPNSLYERLDAQGRHQNMLIAISALLQAECRRQPVVLELEDGHWFDDASHELLTFLLRQTADVPLLVLLTSRFHDDGTRPAYPLPPETPVLSLSLTALTPPDVRALAQDVLGQPIDDELHSLLLDKSQANPFFAQQILHYLRDSGALCRRLMRGRPVMALAARSFDLPPTLNSLLVARLDRLPAEVKDVVQTAAVLGRQFEFRLLAEMLERDLTDELARAEAQQIWAIFSTLEYIFQHALLRDAAYDMQLRTRLRDLHFLAAVTGERLYANQLPAYTSTLAHHFETAYLLGEAHAHERAVRYLRDAGHQALERFEHRLAIDHFSRALALVLNAGPEEQFQLLLAREQAYDMQGNRAAQQQDFEQLAELSRHLGAAEQGAVALRRANLAESLGAYGQALVQAQTAVSLSEQSGDLSQQAAGYWAWGLALWRQGQHAGARQQFQTGVRLARLCGDQKQLANCLHGLGNLAFHQGNHADARGYFEQALAIRRQLGDQFGEGASLNNLGVVVWSQGDYATARGYHEQTLAICREIGDRRGQGMSFSNLGHVAINQGDVAGALDYFTRSLAIRRDISDRYGEAISLNELGAVALATGKLRLAESYYLQAAAMRRELNQPHFLVEDWAGLARLTLADGHTRRARQYTRRITQYLVENPRLDGAIDRMRTFHFTWEVLTALDRRQDADDVLATAVQIMHAYLDRHRAPALRAMYLQQPHHRVLWAAWTAAEPEG